MRIIKTLSTKTKRVLPKDFVHTTTLIQGAVKKGWNEGKKASAIENNGLIKDVFTRSKHIATECRQLKFEQKDIPVVAAAIAYLAPIPIPGLTLYTYGIALGITKLINTIKNKPQ